MCETVPVLEWFAPPADKEAPMISREPTLERLAIARSLLLEIDVLPELDSERRP